MKIKICALLFAGAILAGALVAKPIVSYQVTGSPGDWNLDFTIDNTTDQDLYFFGVLLPATDITGFPTGWESTVSVNTSIYGGWNSLYNNVWITADAGVDSIPPGDSLSGFIAGISTTLAPTYVQWFAFTFDGYGGSAYTGTDYFNSVDNPGFQGLAIVSAVPEPASLLLTAGALVSLASRRRRRKTT